MGLQQLVEVHVDVSLQFLEFGTEYCLAKIRVFLLLTTETIAKRTGLRIKFGFYDVESYL
jgi:hypothetical protein